MTLNLHYYSLLQQPPQPTLFPYTTLFRSVEDVVAGELFLGFGERSIEDERPAALRAEDRKSTRLNSSHGSISYAVFCLKKKIKLHALQMRCRCKLAV